MKIQPKSDAIPDIWPELPSIASYYLRKERMDEFCNAMADILCWLDGFKAGGGEYSPQTQESLRGLSDALKSIQCGQSRSNQSHEKPPK